LVWWQGSCFCLGPRLPPYLPPPCHPSEGRGFWLNRAQSENWTWILLRVFPTHAPTSTLPPTLKHPTQSRPRGNVCVSCLHILRREKGFPPCPRPPSAKSAGVGAIRAGVDCWPRSRSLVRSEVGVLGRALAIGRWWGGSDRWGRAGPTSLPPACPCAASLGLGWASAGSGGGSRVLGHPRATDGEWSVLPSRSPDMTRPTDRGGWVGRWGVGGQSVLPNAQSWAGVVSGRKGSVLARGASMGGPQS
jgi:hypothetical protein